ADDGGVAAMADSTAQSTRAAVAAANELGRRCYVMTVVWLYRARQQVQLPKLTPLQRLCRTARAVVHEIAHPELTQQVKDYTALFLAEACPLQVEVQEVQAQLEGVVQRLMEQA
ncbi:hypothetical protein Agub_g10977, partial [Astrephomene gubernaculifera]